MSPVPRAFDVAVRSGDPEVARALSEIGDRLDGEVTKDIALAQGLTSLMFPTGWSWVLHLPLLYPDLAGYYLTGIRLVSSSAMQPSDNASRVKIAGGVRTLTKFDVVGDEFDSSQKRLVAGTPRVLWSGARKIEVGEGLEARVTQLDYPPIEVTGMSLLWSLAKGKAA